MLLTNINKHRFTLSVLLTSQLISPNVYAEDSFIKSLTGGKMDFSFRLRYESVDDESKAIGSQDADALTARTTLGYKTADFHNFFAYGEFENITAITDDDQYNDTTNGLATLPIIADPDGTDVNQAFIGFKPHESTLIKAGRQVITPRNAPFHRFMGNVLWRQNWSTYDAITLTNTSLPDTKILAGYIWNNNFITEADRDLEAPIFNIQYDGFKYANLEAYYYDMNFTNLTESNGPGGIGAGNKTIGARISGAYPINETAKLIYAGEFASQTESDDHPVDYDANYYLAEGGFKFAFKDSFVKSLMAKISYEVLEGDTLDAFQTPLATGHAYQGWADNFLLTPTTGIEDTYLTMVATGAWDTKLIVSYHMLEAETASFDYGDELDIWFTKKFAKRYTVGLKYSDYDASSDVGNTKATDLSKFWAYFAFKF